MICPPGALQDLWSRKFPDPVAAFASGWMRVRARARQRGVELPLVISDHADWDGLTATIDGDRLRRKLLVTHGEDDALVHWARGAGLAAEPLHLSAMATRSGDAGRRREARAKRVNRFAELLDRLAYEPRRIGKLRLMTDYFRTTPDPERGYALAALTGALSSSTPSPASSARLIAERTDPVLFALSYDYVGDLSETVALMWPAPDARPRPRQIGAPLTLTEVVMTLGTLGKARTAAHSSRAGSTRSTRPAAGPC